MRFAIALPQFYDTGEFDPAAFRAYVRRAEELGFHSGWTQERQLGGGPQIGPLETMSYAAACSERLRLGCAVFVTPQHSPVHLAKSLASLDQLSLGRVEAGVGSGGRGRDLRPFGVTGEGLITRFTEGIELMRRLWREPSVDFDGRFWQLSGATMAPKPVQQGGPPVWFGGSHPNALRRALRLGDGFFGAGSSTTAQFAEQVKLIRSEGPADFPVAKRVYIHVDDDGDRARARIADGLEMIYGTRSLSEVAVAGTPDECVRGVQEVADAGAEMVLFTTTSDQPEQMERLAAEVMPRIG